MTDKPQVLSQIRIPRPLRYLPRGWLRQQGPEEVEKLYLIQACERLQIPPERWPRFGSTINLQFEDKFVVNTEPFRPPLFDTLRDSRAEWQAAADKGWRDYCKTYLQKCQIATKVNIRIFDLQLLRRPRHSGRNAPLKLRYEWAAWHYCLGESWACIQKKYRSYSQDKIRKHSREILQRVGLASQK
jgi:hypothetical protein